MNRIGIVGMFLTLAVWTPRAAALDIVRNGRPSCTVVIPDERRHWDKVGATWVQQYVQKATGAELPIVGESRAPEGALISLGHTEMARRAGVRTDDLKYDGCKLLARGKVLYLIGRDTPGLTPKATGTGAGARGTCRAATKFLEDVVGVRWLIPTPAGECVPRASDIAVSDELDVSFSPAFAYAHGRYLYGYGPASIANNFRTAVLVRSYGGHSYYPWVPKEKYAKDYPEYFVMTASGTRDPGQNHLCTSNPKVRELLKKGLFADFESGYDWVENNQTDGYQRCQCPKCEAMDNYAEWVRLSPLLPAGLPYAERLKRMSAYPCERLHLTHKWLIDEAKKRYPDKKVMQVVYSPTAVPPKTFDYFGDNVVLEICGNADPALIEMWKGKAPAFTTYVCWFDVTCGYGIDIGMTAFEAAERIRGLHDSGCLGIYFGGGGTNWGYMGPTYYVMGKLMGDPALDAKALLKEYCDGLYGSASRDMQDFFDLLYSRVCMKPVVGASVTDMQIVRYPTRFILSLEETLDRADLSADTDRERNLIRLTRDQFELNKLLTFALLNYRTWRAFPTESNWKELRDSVEALDRFRECVMRYDDAFANAYFPGHGKFCNYLSSRASGTVYYSSWRRRREEVLSKPIRGTVIGYRANAVSVPLTLSFDKPPVLRGLVAPRAATPPVLDGKLDDPAWAKAKPEIVPPMLAAQANARTAVRVVYDDEKIYVAFECEEPFIDKLAVASLGRDGRIWTLDCGEILLAPDRSRRRHHHWIIAPAKDALYDDRTGYKTLDDQDDSWNGPCEYGHLIDRANKRWFLEVAIPFSTLGVNAPTPGEWWLGNFGRERQASKKRTHGAPDLFLWSQEESLGFVDPAAFGRIRFGE